MKLTKENGTKLFQEFNERFTNEVEVNLKNEGINCGLERYCTKVGLSVYQVFLMWYNETIDEVDSSLLESIKSSFDEPY